VNTGERSYSAGHRVMVGLAIARKLQATGYSNLLLLTHGELGLSSRLQAAPLLPQSLTQ